MSETAIPLVRRGRRNARYTAISNEIIDHPTLSCEARIALIYLLSKPDDWLLQINDIRRVLGTGGRLCGRNKAYEVIRELKTAAHVVAVEELRKGRFHRLTYYVFDEPLSDPEGFKAEVRGELRAESYREAEGLEIDRNAPRPENREAVASPCPENREAVASPRPRFRDPGKRHLTKDRKTQITESPPPPPKRPQRCAGASAREGGHFDFLNFWGAWPASDLPRDQAQAADLFARLSPEERRSAVKWAPAYRATRGGPRGFAPMLPYLRHRLFAEFDGAPEIDGDHFVITPERPEWAPWVDHLRARHSASVVERQAAKGRFLAPTRWPPNAAETSPALDKISTRLSA